MTSKAQLNDEVQKLQLKLSSCKDADIKYNQFKKKIIKCLYTEDLIQELKRRKIIKFNWDTMKYEEKNEQSN